MKKLLSVLFVMLCMICGAQTFYQFNRFTTNLDTTLVNGGNLTNINPSANGIGSVLWNTNSAGTFATNTFTKGLVSWSVLGNLTMQDLSATSINLGSGSITANGSGLSSLNASSLSTGTVPNAQLSYRAGTTNIGNLSTSQVVLFTSAMANANYSVSITFDTAVASAVSAAATSKTVNGFTITLSAGIAGTTAVDYTAWPYR